MPLVANDLSKDETTSSIVIEEYKQEEQKPECHPILEDVDSSEDALNTNVETVSDKESIETLQARFRKLSHFSGLPQNSYYEKDRPYFETRQKWEGCVLDLNPESFVAHLVDKTKDNPDEEVEIPFDEVSDDDRDLVQPGAIFYWNIGYEIAVKGSRKRMADLRFRRLPVWTKSEKLQAEQEAERTAEALGWTREK